MSYAPLFIIGVARSGTTLYAHLLSQHPKVAIASDVLFPLYRSFRSSALSSAAIPFDSSRHSAPIHHYYFSEEGQRERLTLKESLLTLNIPSLPYDELIASLMTRAAHEAGDLIPHIDNIRVDTYADLIQSVLQATALQRKSPLDSWVGTKEVWIIEFLPQLKKVFSDARFLIVLRNPASCLGSAMTIPDQAQRPHPLSFLRHWRKHAAYTWDFLHDKDYQDCILVSRYEDLTQNPKKEIQRIAHFLGLEDLSTVLSGPIFHPVSKQVWGGNSSQRGRLAELVHQEKDSSKPKRVSAEQASLQSLSDYVCGPEAALFHYESTSPPEKKNRPLSSVIAEQLFPSHCQKPYAWQDNALSTVSDAQLEETRLLGLGSQEMEITMQRQHFLFEGVWQACEDIHSHISHRGA